MKLLRIIVDYGEVENYGEANERFHVKASRTAWINHVDAEGDFKSLCPGAPRLFENTLAELGKDLEAKS